MSLPTANASRQPAVDRCDRIAAEDDELASDAHAADGGEARADDGGMIFRLAYLNVCGCTAAISFCTRRKIT